MRVDGMDTDILVVLLVWLTIGVVIGGWISIDTFRRKVKGAKWVAAGIFLSVIGLALYLWMRNKASAQANPPSRIPLQRTGRAGSAPRPMGDTTVREAAVDAPRPSPRNRSSRVGNANARSRTGRVAPRVPFSGADPGTGGRHPPLPEMRRAVSG